MTGKQASYVLPVFVENLLSEPLPIATPIQCSSQNNLSKGSQAATVLRWLVGEWLKAFHDVASHSGFVQKPDQRLCGSRVIDLFEGCCHSTVMR